MNSISASNHSIPAPAFANPSPSSMSNVPASASFSLPPSSSVGCRLASLAESPVHRFKPRASIASSRSQPSSLLDQDDEFGDFASPITSLPPPSLPPPSRVQQMPPNTNTPKLLASSSGFPPPRPSQQSS